MWATSPPTVCLWHTKEGIIYTWIALRWIKNCWIVYHELTQSRFHINERNCWWKTSIFETCIQKILSKTLWMIGNFFSLVTWQFSLKLTLTKGVLLKGKQLFVSKVNWIDRTDWTISSIFTTDEKYMKGLNLGLFCWKPK